jgi:hypothetical protein
MEAACTSETLVRIAHIHMAELPRNGIDIKRITFVNVLKAIKYVYNVHVMTQKITVLKQDDIGLVFTKIHVTSRSAVLRTYLICVKYPCEFSG